MVTTSSEPPSPASPFTLDHVAELLFFFHRYATSAASNTNIGKGLLCCLIVVGVLC